MDLFFVISVSCVFTVLVWLCRLAHLPRRSFLNVCFWLTCICSDIRRPTTTRSKWWRKRKRRNWAIWKRNPLRRTEYLSKGEFYELHLDFYPSGWRCWRLRKGHVTFWLKRSLTNQNDCYVVWGVGSIQAVLWRGRCFSAERWSDPHPHPNP